MVLKASKQKGITFGRCDINTGQRVFDDSSASKMTDILPEQAPPKRETILQPANVDLYDGVHLNLTCTPALGQATTIPSDQHSVKFVVCVETSASEVLRGQEPQIVIWHNHNGEHDWCELILRPTQPLDVLLVGRQSREKAQLWYRGELSGSPKHAHAVSFTLKARVGGHWTWSRDATGLSDGVLLYNTQDYQKHAEHDFKQFFSGISSDIVVKSVTPDTANTLLYSLEAPVVAAQGDVSGSSQIRLGKPTHLARWFAIIRTWIPWLAPRQGNTHFALDKDAILASFLRSDGMHVVALAVSGVEDVLTTFTSDTQGNVYIKIRNDRPTAGIARILVAVADTFDVANAAVFYHSRHIVADLNSTELSKAEQISEKQEVDTQWLEEWYDGFTYCTWNALGQDLSAKKIYDALDDLTREGINITNLIIDDNWQSLSGEQGVTDQINRGWLEFEANKKGFPDGLKGTTSAIRGRHPNVKHIAVWHALFGYWGGVSPDGWIAKNYKTIEVPKNEGSFTVVAADDVGRMYNDFYKFLAENGVDSVKTDAQFMTDEIRNAPDRKALITEYQDAWTIAHLRHLSSRAISCMSQTPQIIFHSQLPTNKPRLLVRNSDDFFPEIDASHPWHVFCNAHNSLISQHLNVLPDWDMFQTSHKWAAFHAAARCVSGGPIYFTDYPGHHNVELIKQMTAETTRNTTIILRPDIIGKSINPYNEYTAQSMLKVGTFAGHAQTGTGILGVFNVSQRTLREFVKLEDIPGTEHGEYVVHSFVSSEISKPLQRVGKHSFLGVMLRQTGWDILSAYPLRSFELHTGDVQVALFGLLNKMTGSAAVTGSDIYIESNGRLRVWASFKALGTAGLYISTLPEKSVADDFFVLMYGKPVPQACVSINKVSDKLLEIDIEKAWKQNAETPGWSNEVSIEIFMR
ncbi:hypothetical protein AMS68_002726 [Peltaster fructicola]|uniref:Uncharacterized protein n=1 Tax=Peltaster fructicola TaxID=286661 RepID=A0A6H0XRF5_9PEZI|nr:hypothetical protein AMS68_002726 [Peltaster fructicola]